MIGAQKPINRPMEQKWKPKNNPRIYSQVTFDKRTKNTQWRNHYPLALPIPLWWFTDEKPFSLVQFICKNTLLESREKGENNPVFDAPWFWPKPKLSPHKGIHNTPEQPLPKRKKVWCGLLGSLLKLVPSRRIANGHLLL